MENINNLIKMYLIHSEYKFSVSKISGLEYSRTEFLFINFRRIDFRTSVEFY